MKDDTRNIAILIQKGVRDAKSWHLGPFSFWRVEYAVGVSWSLMFTIRPYCLQIALNRNDYNNDGNRQTEST